MSFLKKKYSNMDTEPKNNKSPEGCLSGTAGIISAIALLITAITGLLVVFHDSNGSKSFSAVSHCAETNVNGYGKNGNEGLAQSIAIGECIRNGGVPDCCASDVRVSQD
jgi:hypothetical protein